MQPSTARTGGRQLGLPAVSKQEGSAAAKPRAAKHTSSRHRSLAGTKRVTFAECQGEQAPVAAPACSKPSMDATARHGHARAVRRRRRSPAAEGWQLPHQPGVVPDTYAELGESGQNRAEGTAAAGKRMKNRQTSRSAEDRCFVRQFAAEAGALLGIASSSRRQAVHRTPQQRSMSPEAPKPELDQALGQSSALPGDAAVHAPVSASSSQRQAAHCSPQELLSLEVPTAEQEGTLNHSLALPGKVAVKEPVMSVGSATQARASPAGIGAAQKEPLTATPNDRTATAGKLS